MTFINMNILTVIVITLLALGICGSPSDIESNTNHLAKANNNFALHLYQTLAMDPDMDNIFFSPISISTALAMIFLGARGNTANQMIEVLKFNTIEESNLHSSFAELNTAIFSKSADKYTLNKANRLFGHKDVSLMQAFRSDTDKHYSSDMAILDFVKDIEGARQFINSWVERETKNKIRELIAPGFISDMTKLVLVNAIYFKADWVNKFDTKNTYDQDFHISEREIIQIPMMHRKSKYLFGEDISLRCKILQLPYVGKHMSMVVILPYDVNGLERLKIHLAYEQLSNLLNKLNNITVSVSLPKFKLEETIVMNDVLSKMGMQDLFHPDKADLSGITGTKDLFVSSVIHKAFLEVNEEGSEAAAATAVTLSKRSINLTPEFIADHPFLFFIMDVETKTVIFMGHYRKPFQNNSNHVEL